MNTVALPGLDAQNPLAFFAALGLLRVVDDAARAQSATRPRLRFEDRGSQVPILESDLDFEGLAGVALEDAARWKDHSVLRLAYGANGHRADPAAEATTRDLKPSPALAREILAEAAEKGRREADFAAACFSELVQDTTNGRTKPTAFHFTAGNQTFLAMVDELREKLTREHLEEALLGPWRGISKLPSLSWDSTVARFHALRAEAPSKEKRGSVPGANWLAVRAFPFFPTAVRRGRLETTCVEGGWKDSTFRWPLWNVAATVPVAASLLKVPFHVLTVRERDALGVSQVFSVRILRSDQGGYGSFAPAAVVLPRSRRAEGPSSSSIHP